MPQCSQRRRCGRLRPRTLRRPTSSLPYRRISSAPSADGWTASPGTRSSPNSLLVREKRLHAQMVSASLRTSMRHDGWSKIRANRLPETKSRFDCPCTDIAHQRCSIAMADLGLLSRLQGRDDPRHRNRIVPACGHRRNRSVGIGRMKTRFEFCRLYAARSAVVSFGPPRKTRSHDSRTVSTRIARIASFDALRR